MLSINTAQIPTKYRILLFLLLLSHSLYSSNEQLESIVANHFTFPTHALINMNHPQSQLFALCGHFLSIQFGKYRAGTKDASFRNIQSIFFISTFFLKWNFNMANKLTFTAAIL